VACGSSNALVHRWAVLTSSLAFPGPDSVLGALQGLSMHFLPQLWQRYSEVGGAVSVLVVSG